jgi:hypothetical protein
VLTGDGCISFVDFAAARLTGRLQLTFPGCRAVSFSTDARANSMAVVCSDGLARLYDLSVIHAQHTNAGRTALQQQELQVLQAAELQLLLAECQGAAQQPPHHGAAAAANAVLMERTNTQTSISTALASQRHAKPTTSSSNASGSRRGAGSTCAAGAQQLAVPPPAPASPAAVSLSQRKLQDILAVYGEFPARHRHRIW